MLAVSHERYSNWVLYYIFLALKTLTTNRYKCHVLMAFYFVVVKHSIYHCEKIEDEVLIGPLDNFWAGMGFSYWIGRSKLPVSYCVLFSYNKGISCSEMLEITICFRDYDLGMICTSKCDDAFVQCIAACGSSDCFVDCNRSSIACTEGKTPTKVEKRFCNLIGIKILTFSLSM